MNTKRKLSRALPIRFALKLKNILARDTSIMVGGNLLVNAARIISTIVLTRLLTAADYGAIGVITSVTMIFVLISDVGFYAYIVRHKEGENPRFLDEVWTLRLVRSILLAGLIAILAVPIAGLFAKPTLSLAITISGALLVVEATSSLAFATAPRSGEIRRVTLVDVIPVLFQIPVAILLALWLHNYWAIIAGMFLASSLKSALSYFLFKDVRRRFAFSAARARDVWAFGRHIVGASVIQLIIGQADKIVLARLLPLSEFGLYMLAVNLAAVPATVVTGFSSRILYPIFARGYRTHNKSQQQTYYQAGKTMRRLYVFAAAAFVACAPLVISILYDDRYLGAASYLQILALGSVFKLSILATNELMMAAGRTDYIRNQSALRLVSLLLLGVALVYAVGPIGLVIAVVGVDFVAQFYCWYTLASLGILRPRTEFRFIMVALAGFGTGAALNWMGLKLVS